LSPSCSFSCYVEEIAKMVSTVHMAVLALVSLVGVGAFKGEVPKCYELANSGGPIEKNLDVQLIIDNTNAAALIKLKTMLTTKFANDFVMPNTRFALTTIGTTQQVFSLEKGKTLTLFKTSVASISKGTGPLNGQVVQAMSKAYSEYQKEMRKHAHKVVIVFLTGSIGTENVAIVVKKWTDMGATIFAVGPDDASLKKVAGDKSDNTYVVTDPEDILQTLIWRTRDLEYINCEKCRAKATMLKTAETKESKGTFVPECEGNNVFAAKQCGPEKCWCATESGMEIDGTRQVKTATFDCAAKRTAFKEAIVKSGACEKQKAKGQSFQPTCDSRGLYRAKQCLDSINYCWCSRPDGSALPNTVHAKSAATPPKCYKLRDTRFECTGKPGLKPHPFNDAWFISCGAADKAYSCGCPSDLIFNAKEGVCVNKPTTAPATD